LGQPQKKKKKKSKEDYDPFTHRTKIMDETKENVIGEENKVFAFCISKVLLLIQSLTFIDGTGIPTYLVKISNNGAIEAFHNGVKMSVSSIINSHKKKSFCTKWSVLCKVLQHLDQLNENEDEKLKIHKNGLNEQIHSMNCHHVGEKKYSTKIMVLSFLYYAMSRCTYKKIRENFLFPATTTLQKLTARVSKIVLSKFINIIFSTLKPVQKLCIVLIDEVYVKQTVTYHGGHVFGIAKDDPAKFAKTLLTSMIVCLRGGPKLVASMVPVAALTATFQKEETNEILESIKMAEGTTKAIICDNNHVNQAYYNSFEKKNAKKPWLASDGTYLLYDFVHLMKNLRNNWLTEKSQQLRYIDPEDKFEKVADWLYLQQLLQFEEGHKTPFHNSPLTKTAVYPKTIERQNVDIALQVFSERTAAAIKCRFPGNQQAIDTARFISIVVKWWDILNVKQKGLDEKLNDINRKPIFDKDDPRLTYLLDFGKMALQMKGKVRKRVNQLTNDTGKAVWQTCFGIVALCKSLLNEHQFEYVLLGQLSTDPLEKHFSKLREGSGGTYFITVQDCLEKFQIYRTKKLLQACDAEWTNLSNKDFIAILDDIEEEAQKNDDGKKKCACVNKLILDEATLCFIDMVHQVDEKQYISKSEMESLVFVSGYLTRKHDTEKKKNEEWGK
jgi:hypothetical protein